MWVWEKEETEGWHRGFIGLKNYNWFEKQLQDGIVIYWNGETERRADLGERSEVQIWNVK